MNLKEKHAGGLVLSKLWNLDCMEEVSWRHKSRALWLKEGDKNTRFFHGMENARKRIKFIGKIHMDRGFTIVLAEV